MYITWSMSSDIYIYDVIMLICPKNIREQAGGQIAWHISAKKKHALKVNNSPITIFKSPKGKK